MRLIMRLTKKLVNIWILLVVSTFPPSASGKAITCTAGDFAAGTNASFVCYFPDDIDDHDSVYIEHYPINALTNASGSKVLLCKVGEVKASTCKGKDGYIFKGYTRNTISVEVVSVTEEAAGRYTCQFVPPSQSPTDMCNLAVHGAVTPSSSDDRHSKSATVSVEVLVAVIIVSVLVVAAAIVFAVFMYRRLRSKKSSAPTERREESRRESVTTPAAGLNDSAAPLLQTQDTRFSSPAPSSTPTETRESKQESVNSPAAGSTSTETRKSKQESVNSPAAGSVGKPPFETQESVESYMKPLADFAVGKNSASQPRQNSSKTAMPSVQDGIDMDSGVDLSSLKFTDTDKLKLSGSKENISYNYDKKKTPMPLANDSNKTDPASHLIGMYTALGGFDERLKRIEEVTSSFMGQGKRDEVDLQTLEAKLNTAAKRRQP